MKKTKIIIVAMIVTLLLVSSMSASAAGHSISAKEVIQSKRGVHLKITNASTLTWGKIYRPGGELITVEDFNVGMNGLAQAYDEETNISAAYTFNKASGKLFNGINSSSARALPNGISLEHRNLQAAGQLIPMNESASAMGSTDTQINFIPRTNNDYTMVRLEVSISYYLMISATEDYMGQNNVNIQYYDDYNMGNWTFQLNDGIYLPQAGYESINDTYSFFVDVPSGTHCHASIGTDGASGSIQQGFVSGMSQSLADISMTITVK